MGTRSEHIEWCKERAREILKRGDSLGAWASFVSDMSKHVEAREHPAILLGIMMHLAGHFNAPGKVQEFIEGFN